MKNTNHPNRNKNSNFDRNNNYSNNNLNRSNNYPITSTEMEITLATIKSTILPTVTPTNLPIKRTTLMLMLDATTAINLGIGCKIAEKE